MEKRRIDVLEQQISDLVTSFYESALKPNYQELKASFSEDLKPKLEAIDKFLGQGPFVNVDNISYVDFLLYEYLVRILLFVPELFEQFPKFGALLKRIEALPNVGAFIKKQGKILLIGYPDKCDAKY